MPKSHRKEVSLSSQVILLLQQMADAKGECLRNYMGDVISTVALNHIKPQIAKPKAEVMVEAEKPITKHKIIRKEVNLTWSTINELNKMADASNVCLMKYMSAAITSRVVPIIMPEKPEPKLEPKKSEACKAVVKPIRKEVGLSTSILDRLTAMAEENSMCLRVYMERVISNRAGANLPISVDKKAERKAKSRAAASGSNINSPNRKQNDKIQGLAESIARRYDCNDPCLKANMSQLITLISPKLKYHIHRIIDNQIDTEEVLSNTVEKIVLKINTYDPFWRFTTWAFKIATNESKLYKNKRKPITPSFDIAETVKSFDVSVENIEGKKNFENLYELAVACIQEYPDCVDKSIFIDKDINRMQLKELSEKYSLNENTVKTKLKSMRAKIKKSMMIMDSEACRKYETFKNISHEWV